MKIKNIIITGAGGFVGSHLTEKCIELGYSVTAFVHYNSFNNWGWLEKSPYKNKLRVISGDINNYDSVFAAVKGHDTIFNLAALIGIPYSYISPLAYIKTNIEGTYNILQAARELKIKNTIITSTSETYGTAQYAPINESHPANAQSPYAATKVGADQIALSFYRSYGLPVKIARPFNIYGPRQSARAIIPSIIIQMLSGQKIIRLGNTDPARDLTFIEDAIKGFLAIAKSDRLFGEVTNIGTGQEISIGSLAHLIANIMKIKIKIQEDNKRIRPNKSEVKQLLCDNTKLIRATGWKPECSLKKGLAETINWIKENKDLYKDNLYNI